MMLADNRMHQGMFRYGPILKQPLNKYDAVEEIYKRTDIYKETKNLEYLVDLFNMVRIEYYKAKKRGQKLTMIDDGHHAEEKE